MSEQTRDGQALGDGERESVGRRPDWIGYDVTNDRRTGEANWKRVGAGWTHRDGKGFDFEPDNGSGRITMRERWQEHEEAMGSDRQERRTRDDGPDERVRDAQDHQRSDHQRSDHQRSDRPRPDRGRGR